MIAFEIFMRNLESVKEEPELHRTSRSKSQGVHGSGKAKAVAKAKGAQCKRGAGYESAQITSVRPEVVVIYS